MKKIFIIILVFITSCTFENYNENNNKIIFLGDSITERCNWSELLDNDNIINYGIGGNTTQNIIDRIDSVIGEHPETVFLLCGINDVDDAGGHADYIFNNIVYIIETLQSNGIEVISQSIIYTSPQKPKYLEYNLEVTEINYNLEKYCKDNNIEYINLNSVLSENSVLIDVYTVDGVHLNEIGYNKWKSLLKGLNNVTNERQYKLRRLRT